MLYLVRYGELALKNDRARNFFEKCLVSNIKAKAKADVRRERGRIFVEGTCPFLKYTFGIVSYSKVKECASTPEAIKQAIRHAKISKGETFAVRVNRAWKGFPLTSRQLEASLGSDVCKRTGAEVDLKSPDKTIYIDIRENSAYIFSEKLPGPGGLPVGTGGKIIALVRDRVDLLACWMMMKRGCTPVILSKGQAKPLQRYAPKLRVYTDPRPTYEKALRLAKRENALAIVTGDPLTIYADEVLVFRPLLGFTKNEIKAMVAKIL